MGLWTGYKIRGSTEIRRRTINIYRLAAAESQHRKASSSSSSSSPSVTMLLMMVGFFTPLAGMAHPERVARVHDFYTHKLQVSEHQTWEFEG